MAIHCAGGRDRTGQITMLLLALAGVTPDEIAADYALSVADDTARLEAFLAEQGTTARDLIVSTLAGLDIESCLVDAGLTANDLAAVRQRLL